MKKKINLVHFSVHRNIIGNAGDKIHIPILRKAFNQFLNFKITWHLKEIWENTSQHQIRQFNKKKDGIVIGGGGIFLKDQSNSSVKKSGYQLNLSVNEIKKIKIPMIFFGIGYNRFRNQKDFNDKIVKNVRECLKKKIFYGLRNSGSIEKLSKRISVKKNKFDYQPCITTILDKIDYFKDIKIKNSKKKIIGFGFAADRIKMRFSSIEKEKLFLKTLTDLIESTPKNYKILFIYHKDIDNYFYNQLDKKYQRKISEVNINNMSIKSIYKFYHELDLVFAMRGHHQLISLGTKTNFFSFITHDKIKFVCKDNGLKNYSSDINLKNFYSKTINFYKNYFKQNKKIKKIIKKAFDKNYKITKQNFLFIENKLLKINKK